MSSDAYHSETIIYKGRELTIEHVYDHDSGPPWKGCDGHGPVRLSHGQHRNHDSKRPGERPMNDPDRTCWQYYYDWQEAIKLARKDGWGLSLHDYMSLMCKLRRVPTSGDVAHAAVERDFQFLSGWCNDQWDYMGVVVTDVETDASESLWGIESCFEDYIKEVADELCEQVYLPSIRALIRGVA